MDIDFHRHREDRHMSKKPTKQESSTHGTLAFSELTSTDPKATRSFLERTFGWSFESVAFPMGEYLSFKTPGGGRGGGPPAGAKGGPGRMEYVRGEGLRAAGAGVQSAGAQGGPSRERVAGGGGVLLCQVA